MTDFQKFKIYLQLARFDHWVKNVFVLPGTFVAMIFTRSSFLGIIFPLGLALLATGFIASANYIINEYVDREFDRHHPKKKHRKSVAHDLSLKWVLVEYFVFILIGLSIGYCINKEFTWALCALLVMGFLYNIRPFRTKERVHLDVISESINSPIRMVLGWLVVTTTLMPPISLLIAYWMVGAYMMAIKRFSEYRYINNPQLAALYRKSFAYYNEQKLLTATFVYGFCYALFIGIFLVKHKLEFVFALPFQALLLVWYLNLGFKEDSPTQHPEILYKEKGFLLFLLFVIVITAGLFFIDIPSFRDFVSKRFFIELLH